MCPKVLVYHGFISTSIFRILSNNIGFLWLKLGKRFNLSYFGEKNHEKSTMKKLRWKKIMVKNAQKV